LEEYIKKYRNQNYPGIIQAVKIRIGNEVWFYNTSVTISDDIANHNYENVFLSEIIQYTDLENNLDVTELVFSKTISGTPIYRSRYAQENVDRKEPYFKRIRKYIGQDYLFSCGMTVMIENEKNEIAIGRRSDEHRWAFPAGAKEINEPIIKTVHTETMEELGIKISTPQLMAVFSGEKCKTTYPNGET
jgi:hypothetical protein